MRVNRSALWRHFDSSDDIDKLAVCRYCQLSYSYKSTTGNLKHHLMNKHPEIYIEQLDKASEGDRTSDTKSPSLLHSQEYVRSDSEDADPLFVQREVRGPRVKRARASAPPAPAPAPAPASTHAESCPPDTASTRFCPFVQHVAGKLSEYDGYTKAQVQFKISQILYEADMGLLQRPEVRNIEITDIQCIPPAAAVDG